MKKLILSLISVTFLFGLGVRAEFNAETAKQKVMEGLQERGYLKNLNDQEFKSVENLVDNLVSNKFSEFDRLNLSEGARQEAFVGKIGGAIKDIGGKILDLGKKAIEKMKAMAKAIASKVGPFVQKYGPKLITFGKQMLPVVAPAAGEVAKNLGVPEDVVKGIVGQLSKKDQEEIADQPEKIADLVTNQIEEGGEAPKE